MTDLQPTGLAFGRLNIWFLLTFGCKLLFKIVKCYGREFSRSITATQHLFAYKGSGKRSMDGEAENLS